MRTSCWAFGPYLRLLLDLRPRLEDRLLLAEVRGREERLLAEVRRLRERLLLRDVLALPDDERRRDRARLDVERLRGDRRDELLELRFRLRVDELLVGIPSHSPCLCLRIAVMRPIENEIA